MVSSKPRRLYAEQISFHPYKDNMKEIRTEQRKTDTPQAEIVRGLVDEALRARRLRQLGSDTTAKPYQQLAKEALTDELKPLKNSLVEMAHTINQFRDEFSLAGKTQPGSSVASQGVSFELRIIILLLLSTLSKVIAHFNMTWTLLGAPALTDRQGFDAEDLNVELGKFLTEAQDEAKMIEQTYREAIPRSVPDAGTGQHELRSTTPRPGEIPS